jgi:tetraacyldisaccharide 4'-kinase
MRTAPGFWAEPPGILADLLLPIGAAWDAAGRLRRALSQPYRASVPVICVGNLVAGGAGKTPVAAALAADLAAQGVAVHVVTRGYGGRLGGPVRVDAARHDAAQTGDEALLLSIHAPCWVASDRAAGIRAAIAAGARVIVLDDGFQNPAIAKTLSLVVVDAVYRFGNCRVMPAGPLRESLARGLARADALVLLGTEAETDGSRPSEINDRLPVLRAVLSPVSGERLAGSRLLAFAGIGRPEKFFGTLQQLGADLVDARSFPDHHRFGAREIENLYCEAERAQARLVTTAKDIVRVPPASRSGIEVLEVVVRWRDPDAIATLIERALGNRCRYKPAEGNDGERS